MGEAHQNTALPLLGIEADELTYKASQIYLLTFFFSFPFFLSSSFPSLQISSGVYGSGNRTGYSRRSLVNLCTGEDLFRDEQAGGWTSPTTRRLFISSVVVFESITSRVTICGIEWFEEGLVFVVGQKDRWTDGIIYTLGSLLA